MAGFDVAIKEGTGSFIDDNTTGTTYKWNALKRNTSYTVKVRAYDKAANRGPYTNEQSVTTVRDTVAPGAPTGLNVTTTYNTAFAVWVNPTDTDLAMVAVMLYDASSNLIANFKANAVPGGAGSYIFSNLTKATTYKANMQAFDTSGNASAYSDTFVFTTAGGISLDDFTPGLSAINTVTTLPPAAGYTGAKTVLNQADGRLYNYVNGAWSKATDTTILDGTITGSKLVDSSVSAAKISATIGGGNLIRNSSFENLAYNSAYGPLAAGFAPYDNSGGADGMTLAVQANGRRGGNSQLISWTKNTSTKGILLTTDQWVANANITKPNSTYMLSFYARGGGSGQGISISLRWNVAPAVTYITVPNVTGDWQRYVFKLVTGATLDANIFITTDYTGNTAGYFYIDDIQLEEGDVVTAYSPALLPGEVTSDLIADGAVGNAELAVGAVTTTKIASRTITAGLIATGTLTANEVAVGTLTGDRLAVNTINTGNLVIQNRPISVAGCNFRINANGALQWDAGTISYPGDNNVYVTASIAAGASGWGGWERPVNLCYNPANGALNFYYTSDLTAVANQIPLVTWNSNSTDLSIKAGVSTIINGDRVVTGTLDASKIKASSITSAQIASGTIVADDIQAGTLTAAQMAVGAVTASRLAIGSSENLISDPLFTDPLYWTNNGAYNGTLSDAGTTGRYGFYSSNATNDPNNANALGAARLITLWSGASAPPGAGRQHLISQVMPIKSLTTYEISCSYVNSSNQQVYLLVRTNNGDFQWQLSTGTSGKPKYQFTTGANTTSYSLYIYNAADSTYNGSFFAAMLRIVQASGATAIENGAITTEKITVNSLNGDRIATGTLDAAKITAGSVLAGTITVNGKSLASTTTSAFSASAAVNYADTRNDNQPPSYYYAKGMTTVAEFKIVGVLGVATGGYGQMITTIQWGDASGGPVQQELRDSNGTYWNRISLNTTTWGPWKDSGAQVNQGNTQIDPGKITISGSTTLANWRGGGDNTQINGGAVAANTILSNSLKVGARGISTQDLVFEYKNGSCTWGNGVVFFTDDANNRTYVGITAGSCGTPPAGNYYYIYWPKGSGSLVATVDWPTATGPDAVHMATFTGSPNINQLYGGTIVNGTQISTGSITADRMNVGSLSAISANIGSLVSYNGQGGRVERDGNGTRIYDNNGVLRSKSGF